MAKLAPQGERVFKTARFAKLARKSHIDNEELCLAIRQVALGQADDLGGGVYKKRLSRNQYRSIILARSGRYWVYEHLFAKQDQANIEDHELVSLRSIARSYGMLRREQVNELIRDGLWMEICHDDQA